MSNNTSLSFYLVKINQIVDEICNEIVKVKHAPDELTARKDAVEGLLCCDLQTNTNGDAGAWQDGNGYWDLHGLVYYEVAKAQRLTDAQVVVLNELELSA